MFGNTVLGVVIPAVNEESSIKNVINDIPSDVDEIVVVDNGSSDDTARYAADAGATVLHEPKRGYGFACTKGIRYLSERNFEVIAFLDGDYSDFPEELTVLVEPIVENRADFVVGSRVRGEREKGALLPQAAFGNWLAGVLIKLFWNYSFTDLGPFRAIRLSYLLDMDMREMRYGWTVEMQIKAARMKLRCLELPVRYRRRIGKSKVTGTLSGTIKASAGILRTIFTQALSGKRFPANRNP